MKQESILVALLALAAAAGAHAEATAAQTGSEHLQGITAFGLAEGNRLLRFDPSRPAEVRALPLTGVAGTLLGIDLRPADGRLYGVSDANDLYVIDPEAGVATRASSLTLGFEGTPRSGFDFNPQADRLRLVAESGQNLRVHVALGAVATDGPLEYAAGDPHAGARPRVGAVAYTDNVPDAPTTRLFDIDWQRDVLILQEPPNDGALQTVGELGTDFDERGGFDILTRADGGEVALAATRGVLLEIDLETGVAREIGAIGDGVVPLIGLALVPDTGVPAAR